MNLILFGMIFIEVIPNAEPLVTFNLNDPVISAYSKKLTIDSVANTVSVPNSLRLVDETFKILPTTGSPHRLVKLHCNLNCSYELTVEGIAKTLIKNKSDSAVTYKGLYEPISFNEFLFSNNER